MDVKINFNNLSLYWEELQTDAVKTPNINSAHTTSYDEDNYALWEQIVKYCRYLNSDSTDVNNPNHGRQLKILEFGGGAGFSSLYWLACDENTKVTSIDSSTRPFIKSNYLKLKEWFGSRYEYEISSTEDYNYLADPDNGSYDIVVIDASLDTLRHDMLLAEKIQPKCIWIMNTDTEGWSDTGPIIDDLVQKDEYDYFYIHNLIYNIQKFLIDTDNGKTGDDIGYSESWQVNSTLLRLLEIREGEEEPPENWKKIWPEDSDGEDE